MLWPGPAIAWDFSLRQHTSPASKNLRTSFHVPPHRCFKFSRSTSIIGLKIALFSHMSRAASSVMDSSKSGAKFAGCLKNEHVACNHHIHYHEAVKALMPRLVQWKNKGMLFYHPLMWSESQPFQCQLIPAYQTGHCPFSFISLLHTKLLRFFSFTCLLHSMHYCILK